MSCDEEVCVGVGDAENGQLLCMNEVLLILTNFEMCRLLS